MDVPRAHLPVAVLDRDVRPRILQFLHPVQHLEDSGVRLAGEHYECVLHGHLWLVVNAGHLANSVVHRLPTKRG